MKYEPGNDTIKQFLALLHEKCTEGTRDYNSFLIAIATADGEHSDEEYETSESESSSDDS